MGSGGLLTGSGVCQRLHATSVAPVGVLRGVERRISHPRPNVQDRKACQTGDSRDACRLRIDELDIAAVAVRALTEDGHAGARYVLSGPETITQIEQVHAIGEAIGRPLRWGELSRDDVREQLAGYLGKIPDSALDTWAAFVDTPERVTTTVQDITGTRARTFSDWALDHAEQFR